MLAILVPRGLSSCSYVGKGPTAANNRIAARTRDASVTETSRSAGAALDRHARIFRTVKVGLRTRSAVSADGQPSGAPKDCDQ